VYELQGSVSVVILKLKLRCEVCAVAKHIHIFIATLTCALFFLNMCKQQDLS